MKTDYAGIDYGCGTSNIDTKTGIRYGVISQNEVLQAWADSSEEQYEYYCPSCGNLLKKKHEAKRCGACRKPIDPDRDFDFIEPYAFTYKADGYICTQSHDDPDIFIIKSPYFTYCQFCSPCAPGAGYITNYMEHEAGIRAYCFGHDWFENGKAPYPVYNVKTNKRRILCIM